MTSYFVVQGAFAWLEGPLGVETWPRPAAHAWTIAAMAGTSPLFVEPALQACARWP
jgi:hypothetical protein